MKPAFKIVVFQQPRQRMNDAERKLKTRTCNVVTLHTCNSCNSVYIALAEAGVCCKCALYLRMRENHRLTTGKKRVYSTTTFFFIRKFIQAASNEKLPCWVVAKYLLQIIID